MFPSLLNDCRILYKLFWNGLFFVVFKFKDCRFIRSLSLFFSKFSLSFQFIGHISKPQVYKAFPGGISRL